MKERFSQLIEDLGNLLEVDLTLDVNDSCQILVDEKLAIQIEENDREEIIIGSCIGDLMAGRFREDVLQNALITNYLSHEGTFAYNEPNNQLTYFIILPLHMLTANKLQESLAIFSETSLYWFNAISNGKTSPDEGLSTKPTSNNPFFTQ